jgi:uncharacterized membrane protein (GlpM family)
MIALIMDLIFRFIVGGLIVSLFAIIGDVTRPRTFAGLFAAAPSVALATLSLTMWTEGKFYAAVEAGSMIFGAIALCVYASLSYISSRITNCTLLRPLCVRFRCG